MAVKKKCVVTTTINPPTEALLKFHQKDDWELIVIGDLKTPEQPYRDLGITYLSPKEQEKKYPELSKHLGWNTIQRRNIGFIEAYNKSADIIATVDDDNIPYESWGENVVVGEVIDVDLYEPKDSVFDPLSIIHDDHLWHRGFPLELRPNKNEITHLGKHSRNVLVQADLWDGDPDIDAIARLTYHPDITAGVKGFYASSKIAPFNSQNTFIARGCLPQYAVLPFIGRMDDIWGAYLLQFAFPDSVVFGEATVKQERNVQDLIKNLEHEIIGYRHTLEFVEKKDIFVCSFVPDATKRFYEIYQNSFS